MHLPETSIPCPSLHGLSHQDLHRTTRPKSQELNCPRCVGVVFVSPGVDLVVHHVLEPLVVGGTEEDLRVHLSPRVAGVHHLDNIVDGSFRIT